MNTQFILINSIYVFEMFVTANGLAVVCVCVCLNFCESGMSNERERKNMYIFDCLQNIDRYRWIGSDWFGLEEKKEMLLLLVLCAHTKLLRFAKIERAL